MAIYNGLYVPPAVERKVAEIQKQYGRNFPPTHPHAGMDSDRAYVGDPGHCEPCAVVGHVVAHPDYGCDDVKCNSRHEEDETWHLRQDHPGSLIRDLLPHVNKVIEQVYGDESEPVDALAVVLRAAFTPTQLSSFVVAAERKVHQDEPHWQRLRESALRAGAA